MRIVLELNVIDKIIELGKKEICMKIELELTFRSRNRAPTYKNDSLIA